MFQHVVILPAGLVAVTNLRQWSIDGALIQVKRKMTDIKTIYTALRKGVRCSLNTSNDFTLTADSGPSSGLSWAQRYAQLPPLTFVT